MEYPGGFLRDFLYTIIAVPTKQATQNTDRAITGNGL